MDYRIGDIIRPTPNGVGVEVLVLSTPVDNHCEVIHLKGLHEGYQSDSYYLVATELVRHHDIKPYENIKKHEF